MMRRSIAAKSMRPRVTIVTTSLRRSTRGSSAATSRAAPAVGRERQGSDKSAVDTKTSKNQGIDVEKSKIKRTSSRLAKSAAAAVGDAAESQNQDSPLVSSRTARAAVRGCQDLSKSQHINVAYSKNQETTVEVPQIQPHRKLVDAFAGDMAKSQNQHSPPITTLSARAAGPVCHGGGSLDKVSLSLSGEDAITPSHSEKSKCQLTDIVGVFGTIGNDASPRNAEQKWDHTAVGVDAEQ